MLVAPWNCCEVRRVQRSGTIRPTANRSFRGKATPNHEAFCGDLKPANKKNKTNYYQKRAISHATNLVTRLQELAKFVQLWLSETVPALSLSAQFGYFPALTALRPTTLVPHARMLFAADTQSVGAALTCVSVYQERLDRLLVGRNGNAG